MAIPGVEAGSESVMHFTLFLKHVLVGLVFRQQKLSFAMSALSVLLQVKRSGGQEGFVLEWRGQYLMSSPQHSFIQRERTLFGLFQQPCAAMALREIKERGGLGIEKPGACCMPAGWCLSLCLLLPGAPSSPCCEPHELLAVPAALHPRELAR